MSLKPPRPKRRRSPAETRQKLVEATAGLILLQGFAATTVDQICGEAGLTKGSFFHHFEGKDDIGIAAVRWWGSFGTSLYAEAWKNPKADSLKQLHHLFDIMAGFTERPEVCTCVVGMLSQEMAQSHPKLREECARQLDLWTDNVVKLLAAAKAKHRPKGKFDPVEVAQFLNSLWQGSMLVGKTCQTPGMIRQNLRFARVWVDGLLGKA